MKENIKKIGVISILRYNHLPVDAIVFDKKTIREKEVQHKIYHLLEEINSNKMILINLAIKNKNTDEIIDITSVMFRDEVSRFKEMINNHF